jgi:hypothetical protein
MILGRISAVLGKLTGDEWLGADPDALRCGLRIVFKKAARRDECLLHQEQIISFQNLVL